MIEDPNIQNYQKLAFKRFAELGALTLSIEEFIDILFPSFKNEIEAEVLKIAEQFDIDNIWEEIPRLIDNNEFEHPLILALHKNKLFKEIVGPEYSFIDRYPEVFERIYGEIIPNKLLNNQSLSIGLIGSSYGQELITILKYLSDFSTLETLSIGRLKIDVLSKPNCVFQKLKSNGILYPKSLISRYMSFSQLNLCFDEVDSEHLCFSSLVCENIRFLDLNLVSKDDLQLLSDQRYDLILLHNVIQYLQPEQDETLDFVCEFLDLVLKKGGTISIINESKVINPYITRPFEQLYQQSERYSQEVVANAKLYTKT